MNKELKRLITTKINGVTHYLVEDYDWKPASELDTLWYDLQDEDEHVSLCHNSEFYRNESDSDNEFDFYYEGEEIYLNLHTEDRDHFPPANIEIVITYNINKHFVYDEEWEYDELEYETKKEIQDDYPNASVSFNRVRHFDYEGDGVSVSYSGTTSFSDSEICDEIGARAILEKKHYILNN